MKTNHLLLIAGAAGIAYLIYKKKHATVETVQYMSYEDINRIVSQIIQTTGKQPKDVVYVSTGNGDTYYVVIKGTTETQTYPITAETYRTLVKQGAQTYGAITEAGKDLGGGQDVPFTGNSRV